jgi:hypothetical protein
MLVKCRKRAKVGGMRLTPGVLLDLPEWAVREIVDCDPEAVEVIERVRADNLDPLGRLTMLPAGGRLIVKLPEGD